jgi:ATP-dependent RNA helicase SUPV3L1/SUV3
MDADLVQAIEEHSFEPVVAAEWRNARWTSAPCPGLLRSLAAPAARGGLHLARESLDETTLRRLAEDEDIARPLPLAKPACCSCGTWPRRPTSASRPLDEHVRLVRTSTNT